MEWVENIVGKGENAGYSIFPFLTMLSKASSFRVFKNEDYVV